MTDIAYVESSLLLLLRRRAHLALEQTLRFDRSDGKHSSARGRNDWDASAEDALAGRSELQPRCRHSPQPYLRKSSLSPLLIDDAVLTFLAFPLQAKAHIHSNALQADKKGHDAELRSKFKAEWQTELHQWFRDWPQISTSFSSSITSYPFSCAEKYLSADAITRLIAQHNTTILLSISLRFKGPVAPVLEECRLSARETAKMAIGWRDSSIGWANNLIVINIAYAATLLLRIAAAKGGADAETRLLCAAVADLLIRIGAMRPTVCVPHLS